MPKAEKTNPRLIILSGAKSSEICMINDTKSFTVGRVPGNQLLLSDQGISRHHFSIRKEGNCFKIEDLKSHNGTFVNGVKIQELPLKHGDFIRAGQTELLFLTKTESEVIFDSENDFDEDLVTKSEIQLSIEENVSNLPQDLTMLVKIGKTINESKDAETLQKQLLEIILEIIPAERAAVILFGEDLDVPKSVCVLNKIRKDSQQNSFSHKVIERVLTGKVALMSNDIFQSNLETSESLISSKISCLLCAPFILSGIKGLIYLDSTSPLNKFTENHLQQMTAIANLVGASLENSGRLEALKLENENLQEIARIETSMIGESQSMKALYQLISKVAQTDSTVLILGESGSGKELVARALHENSSRDGRPFVALNCAVLNENLLESDLFGHERGAFTGAMNQRKGKIEQAHGGTIFLDEIGELPLPLQAKLLRVLQEREFERVGGSRTQKVDIRVIAATNRNLEEAVKGGSFRQDLFFRLNVVPIRTPPLRERKKDILLLAQHFINKHAARCKRTVGGVSDEAKKALLSYNFPGNVRELENIIERAIVLGSTEKLLLEDLPLEVIELMETNKDSLPGLYEQLKTIKQQIILNALKKNDGNYIEAALELGVHTNNLYRMINNLGIKIEQTRRFS